MAAGELPLSRNRDGDGNEGSDPCWITRSAAPLSLSPERSSRRAQTPRGGGAVF